MAHFSKMDSKFTSDHILVLANWSDELGLIDRRVQLFDLYHRVKYIKTATDEEINSMAIDSIQVIQRVESDKNKFYRVISAWGLV